MKGYTLVEVLFALALLGMVALGIGAIYVAVHFIVKFW